MGYRIPWARLSEAERQRRTARAVAAESRRRDEFKAQLAEIEEANTAAEERARVDYANRDLIQKL